MTDKLTEIDLGKKIIPWLERNGWEIYQEVQFKGYGGIADIVAVRDKPDGSGDKFVWIIELKNNLSLKVLEQADRWNSHFRSVGVPVANRGDRNFAYRVAKKFQIGVLEISQFWDDPRVEVDRILYDHQIVERWVKDNYLPYLTEAHKDFSAAGSAGGGHLTPYKVTMLEVRKYIEDHPGCLMKEIVAEIGHGHYAHEQSAKSNLGKCLDWFESDWCYIHKIYRANRFYCKV